MSFQLNLQTDTVDRAFPGDPVVAEPHAKIRDVLQQMADANQGGTMICRDGKLVGIFTERDALRLMAGDADMDSPVGDVMTPGPDTLLSKDFVAHAISKMSKGGYRRLPIVDNDGRPVGMMRVAGILHYLVEHFPNIVYTLPPEPHHGMQKREGA